MAHVDPDGSASQPLVCLRAGARSLNRARYFRITKVSPRPVYTIIVYTGWYMVYRM